MEFENKVVIVTGGAQGIGKTIAEEFQKQGALVCSIDKQPGVYFTGDLAQQDTLEKFAQKVIAEYGHVDYLIKNALPLMKGIDNCSYEEFNYALKVGVTAPFYLLMLQYMMILNLSSVMQIQMKMLACGNHDNFTKNLQVPHVEVNGKTLGIIGATGSGKTTIVNLLMRYYDPDEGHIYVNGRDVRTYTSKELMPLFGAAFQNDVIFHDTIYENIRFGRDVSKKEAMAAAQDAQAVEFIEEKGLDTMLAIRGMDLSGGQKQRLLITRALAKHPQILVLDDSSSALDYATDARLRRAIQENYGDLTSIIVAQRISSIYRADKIIVLEDGEMIGYGTHKELMESCEVYREISQSQMGGGIDEA